jgi:uncharacterized protein (DUF58 family)
MTFSEVREYMPGDEVRSIDWNVSARMNRAHVKIYGEERDRTLMLLVDMSASGELGSRRVSKRELAAELAAVLAFSAIANGDRVGLVCFSDEVERHIAPKKGKRHVLRVVREILSFEPRSRGTDIGAALDLVARVNKRDAVVVLVSDFLDENWVRSMKPVAKRHELIPVRLRDPLELALPSLGFVLLEDLESGQLLEVDTQGPVADAYREATRSDDQAFVDAMRRLQIDYLDLNTARPYESELVAFFRRREQKRGGLV